jgi:hypothetical protein
MRKPKKQKKPLNDLSHSLTPFEPNHTLIAVIELSKKSWPVAGIIPAASRHGAQAAHRSAKSRSHAWSK